MFINYTILLLQCNLYLHLYYICKVLVTPKECGFHYDLEYKICDFLKKDKNYHLSYLKIKIKIKNFPIHFFSNYLDSN
jgi:hypothetical protein